MQILQWLFGDSHSHHHSSREAISPGSNRRILSDEDEAKVNELILFTRGGACPSSHEEFEYNDQKKEEEEKNEKTITILLTREDSKTWFFSTLHLKQLQNLYRSRRFRLPPPREACGEKGMGHRLDAALVGCKVLPICDAAFAGSKRSDCSDGSPEKDAHKGERRRTISRIKELVKWAAAAKVHRGHKGWKVSYFRSRGNLKATTDELSSSSSKISFRWEVGSCSTSSSVYSMPSVSSSSRNDLWVKQLPSATAAAAFDPPFLDCNAAECRRSAHWITTDSDFVVLEL